MNFRLTESQWNVASTELEAIGRKRHDGDRRSIEIMCGYVTVRRSRHGKKVPRPAYYKKAWEKVASDALKLRVRIAELQDDTETADLTLLSWPGEDDFDHVTFFNSLADFAGRAMFVAELEGSIDKEPNSADSEIDWLFNALVSFWKSCGGNVGVSRNWESGELGGPLMRFLQATYSPALISAGLREPSKEHIREQVRKYQNR